MNRRSNLLISGILGLAMSFSLITEALADTKTNDVSITVNGGEFSLTTPTIKPYGDITLQATPQTYKTSFNGKFTVKDIRGTQEGWRLDVSASQLSGGAGGVNKIPKGSLSLQPISTISRVGVGSGAAPTKVMLTNTAIDNGAVVVAKASAGTGMGVFDITFPTDALSLVVDATTAKAGSYSSTLTWNLVQAP